MSKAAFGKFTGFDIFRLITDRVVRLHHVDEADLTLHTHVAEGFHRTGMRNKHMVTGLNGTFRIFDSRWMHARQITKRSKDDGFVKGGPQFDAITEAFIQQTGIAFKRINDFA